MKYTRSKLKGKAQTVLGPISVDDIGITLCHEHCFSDESIFFVEPKEATAKKLAHEPLTIKNAGYIRYLETTRNLDDNTRLDENEAISELLPFRHAGGRTVVDATMDDLGRDPLALRRISLATGLNIIMGSGYYVRATWKNPHNMDKITEEKIAEEIIRDILAGVRNTGIHSGLIGEIGCTWPLNEGEKKMLRAACMAQKETGAPMHIHPGRSEDAPSEIIKILKEVVSDLTHIAIDHVERTVFKPKNRYFIADSGCYLEYDMWGWEGYYPAYLNATCDIPNDTGRIAQVKDLVAHGYGSQILLSHDIDRKWRHMAYGGHGYNHILQNVVPAMRARDMAEATINDLLVENPKQFLAFR